MYALTRRIVVEQFYWFVLAICISTLKKPWRKIYNWIATQGLLLPCSQKHGRTIADARKVPAAFAAKHSQISVI